MLPQLAEAPTLIESGYDLDPVPWYAVIVPTGTPKAVADRLYREYMLVAQLPEAQNSAPTRASSTCRTRPGSSRNASTPSRRAGLVDSPACERLIRNRVPGSSASNGFARRKCDHQV